MNHTTDCPHCHKGVKYADKHAGLSVNCPACKGEFVIPQEAAEASVPVFSATAVGPSHKIKSSKYGSELFDAFVGHAGLALAFLVGAGSTFSWMTALNDNMYVKDIGDIDPTPGLYLASAILCGVVVMGELVRRELVRIRLEIVAASKSSDDGGDT